ALAALLAQVRSIRDALDRPVPVFVKIAPDLDDADLDAIAEVSLEAGMDGIIATNTTIARRDLASRHAAEAGGLSGQPLFERSTRVLARLSVLTGGNMPLIGVGGIATADQAYAKIQAGAVAVQLYTGLVYHGLSLTGQIAWGLDALLERDGFGSVAEAVGTGRDAWL
ncbi:MAG: dihydroorotate dehydrogenase (quinone), partial [Pseudomonadota bacterium]